MTPALFAACLFAPALLAAEPEHRAQQPDPPAMREQLKNEAAALEKRIKDSPQDVELYLRLGFVYARLEQADDAQKAFESAVKLAPKNAPAHYMLGLIYEKKGLKDKALAAWKACLENAADPRMRDVAVRHIHHLSRP